MPSLGRNGATSASMYVLLAETRKEHLFFTLDGEITPSEYKEIKANLEPQIDKLLQKQLNGNLNEAEYRHYLRKGLGTIGYLPHLFDNAEVKRKQNIIRSMFKENLEFLENKVRTGKLNKLIQLSLATGAESGENKKRTVAKILPLSAGEVPSGFEPL